MTVALSACKETIMNGSRVFQTVFRYDEQDPYFGVNVDDWSPKTEEELLAGPPANPNYRPDLNLCLTASNMTRLAIALDIDIEDGMFSLPASEFLDRAVRWLNDHQDSPSPEIPTTESRGANGMKMVSLGRPAGWLNDIIATAANIASVGIARGADFITSS